MQSDVILIEFEGRIFNCIENEYSGCYSCDLFAPYHKGCMIGIFNCMRLTGRADYVKFKILSLYSYKYHKNVHTNR